MKVVTYDAGTGPRVGRLDDGQVLDVGFDGDMVAFIAAGAPVRGENSEGADRFRGGRELRGLEDRPLDTADMGVGRAGSQQRSGRGDDRQDT